MTLSVGHIGINVSDLARSQAFYAELFGLNTVHETHEGDRHYAFLMGGDGVFLTLWQQSEGTFSTVTPGLHHLAFQVAGAGEVRDFEQKLRAQNVPLIYDGIVSHGEGMDSGGVYFLDPDGVRLEVYSPEGIGDYAPAKPATASCGFF